MPEKSTVTDKLFEVLFSKDVTEAILKNITWFFAITTLIRLIPPAINSHEYLFVILAAISFIGIVLLNLVYGVKQILIPIDKGIGGYISLVKDLNKLDGQSDTIRLKRVFSFLFLKKLGLAYLVSSFFFTCGLFSLQWGCW